jgi:hypothetical protein
MDDYGTNCFPDSSSRAGEILRARELAAQEPRIELHGRTLHVWHENGCCDLTWTGEAWRGSCPHGRVHNPRSDPCAEARALGLWYDQGQTPDPRLMIMDENVFEHECETLAAGTNARLAYDAIADVWRDIAQGYAIRRLDWDVWMRERWFILVTARLIYPETNDLAGTALIELREALLDLSGDLPDWFDTLCWIKDRLVEFLESDGWEVNLARRDALCDWIEVDLLPEIQDSEPETDEVR